MTKYDAMIWAIPLTSARRRPSSRIWPWLAAVGVGLAVGALGVAALAVICTLQVLAVVSP